MTQPETVSVLKAEITAIREHSRQNLLNAAEHLEALASEARQNGDALAKDYQQYAADMRESAKLFEPKGCP